MKNPWTDLNLKELTATYRTAPLETIAAEALMPYTIRADEERLQTGVRLGTQGAVGETLLRYYSLMEVAAIARCLPHPLPKEHVQRAKPELQGMGLEPSYPLARQHLARVTGKYTERERNDARLSALYATFLDLNRLAEEDPNVDTFLGVVSTDLAALDAVVGSEQRFIEEMAVPPDEQGRVHRAMHGFLALLAFVRDFDALLHASADLPLARYAFHMHYWRWFHAGARMTGALRAAMGSLMRWQNVSAIDDGPFSDVVEDLEQLLLRLSVYEAAPPVSAPAPGRRRTSRGK